MKLISLLLLISAATVRVAHAESTPREALLALSKSDHTLAIVDPSTLRSVARVPVGEDPHEVIASSDGRFAYVSNYGFGAYNTLAVIDLMEQKALPAIDLGPLRGPHGLAFVGGKVWFTAEAAKAIGSYEPGKKKVDWILGTGQNRTHMIFVSQDLRRIFTTNVSSGTVSIIEKSGTADAGSPGGHRISAPGGAWDEAVIPVGRGSEGFNVSRDGKQLWVANAQDGTVSIIDVAAKKVTETLAANANGANRLKFTPNGKLVFISSLGDSGLTIIDAATHKEIKRLNLGGGAAGIQMQPDGSRAYVACTGGNYVAVIDLRSLKVSGRIDAGRQPDGLAWAVRR
ncbi:MAG: YncE family protein [Bryobacteraceae bacterium]